ncbi:MAG: low specificity L-threonine aldolase [Oscillospiraceae bacterium]|nr:low specificity L-threonine aldolase [Oscillospiraceae bacterium]
MEQKQNKLSFASDYMEGAHPNILSRLVESNLQKSAGYGLDTYSDSAKRKLRTACNCPEADIFFLVGGTQTNATVIDALLKSYQGVIAPESGHISVHEAGAIESNGHKVLALPHTLGKITARQIESCIRDYLADGNHEHMVMPGMVYISQPTEYGTLYSRDELCSISDVCRKYSLPLYVDGARLAYALASPVNDVSLEDLAKLCDVFYIGGTKCGALLGEAVVIPRPGFIPHFFTIMKQHGALLAKGRLLGIQFDELFTDDLYLNIGKAAVSAVQKLSAAFTAKGYRLFFEPETNQLFIILSNTQMDRLSQHVDFSFWEKYDDEHTVVRFATSWASTDTDIEKLINEVI